jgi:hypothetical protein
MVAVPMGCPVGVAGAGSGAVAAVELSDGAVVVATSEGAEVDSAMGLPSVPVQPVAATAMTAAASTDA